MSSEVVFETPFMSVRKSPGGWFFYAERKGIDSVAFVLFDKSDDKVKYCLVNETKPPMEEFNSDKEVFLTTAFGGSQDKVNRDEYVELSEDSKLDLMKTIALSECSEEGGYDITDDSRILFLDKVLLSTQMNQYVYCFAFDVTGLDFKGTRPQDRGEEKATLVWVSQEDIESSECIKARAIVYTLNTRIPGLKTAGRVPAPELPEILNKLTESREALVIGDFSDSEDIKEFIENTLDYLGYITEYSESAESTENFDLVLVFGESDTGDILIDPNDTRNTIKAKILKKEFSLFEK